MYMWTVATFLLITMIEILAISPDDVTSVCWATTNVTEGQNASITCHFGNDISKLRFDARVYHYRPNPVAVLVAFWLNGGPTVQALSGYTMNGNITTSLVLEIPQVAKKHEGRYLCHILKSSLTVSNPCNLTVHALNSTTTFTSPQNSNNVNNTALNSTTTFTSPQNSNNLNNTESPEAEKLDAHIIVLIVLGVVLGLVGMGAALLFIICKHQKKFKQPCKCRCLTTKPNKARKGPSYKQKQAEHENSCANGKQNGAVTADSASTPLSKDEEDGSLTCA